MNHSILAPTYFDARKLAGALNERGFHARATVYGRHHVVLAIAPYRVVAKACSDCSFIPGVRQ